VDAPGSLPVCNYQPAAALKERGDPRPR